MSGRNILMAAVVLCSVSGLACCGKSDQTKIQGSWQVTGIQFGSEKEVATTAGDKEEITITADTLKMSGVKNESSKYTLNSGASPKQLDMMPQDGDDKGKTIKAIYELTDDTLKICVSRDLVTRPTGFSGAEYGVWDLKREK